MQLADKDIESNYSLTVAKRNRAPQFLDVSGALGELEAKIAQEREKEYRQSGGYQANISGEA